MQGSHEIQYTVPCIRFYGVGVNGVFVSRDVLRVLGTSDFIGPFSVRLCEPLLSVGHDDNNHIQAKFFRWHKVTAYVVTTNE